MVIKKNLENESHEILRQIRFDGLECREIEIWVMESLGK